MFLPAMAVIRRLQWRAGYDRRGLAPGQVRRRLVAFAPFRLMRRFSLFVVMVREVPQFIVIRVYKGTTMRLRVGRDIDSNARRVGLELVGGVVVWISEALVAILFAGRARGLFAVTPGLSSPACKTSAMRPSCQNIFPRLLSKSRQQSRLTSRTWSHSNAAKAMTRQRTPAGRHARFGNKRELTQHSLGAFWRVAGLDYSRSGSALGAAAHRRR